MDYTNRSFAFREDKQQFFAKHPPKTPLQKIKEQDLLEIEQEARAHKYSFLLENQKLIEDEFNHLFTVLQNEKENQDAMWSFCYYLLTEMELAYSIYDNKSKIAECIAKKAEIRKRLLAESKEENESNEHFISSVKDFFLDGLTHLKDRPVAKIRDHSAYINLWRGYWVYCRLSLAAGLNALKVVEVLDRLDAALGRHTNVDNIISTINAPNGVLNYFSVGLFLFRIAIDGGMLIKHTIGSKGKERDESKTWERFKHELYKRHCNFLNDLAWGTANFLTNFSYITHITGPAAIGITMGALSVDVCLSLYKWHLAKRDYLIKMADYKQQREDLWKELQRSDLSDEALRVNKNRLMILQKQMDELDLQYRKNQGMWAFVTAAARLVMFGFTASIIFAPVGIVFASLLVGLIGMSMYLSTGAFAQYKEKSLRLEQAKPSDERYSGALKEYQAARSNFIFTMIRNAVIPGVLIASFAIYWPVGIALTVLYVGFQLLHSYMQHRSKKAGDKPGGGDAPVLTVATVHALPEPKPDIKEEGARDVELEPSFKQAM